LQGSLRSHGHMPEGSVSDGIFVVNIQFQGRPCTIAELRDSVVTIIQERQELLDAREREVLEDLLAKVLAAETRTIVDSQTHCRLCDGDACGHPARCPVTQAAPSIS
ncbi:MAG: hypothetical protein ACXVFL_20120, partial [Solirubrobacteraceae bacterium]